MRAVRLCLAAAARARQGPLPRERESARSLGWLRRPGADGAAAVAAVARRPRAAGGGGAVPLERSAFALDALKGRAAVVPPVPARGALAVSCALACRRTFGLDPGGQPVSPYFLMAFAKAKLHIAIQITSIRPTSLNRFLFGKDNTS